MSQLSRTDVEGAVAQFFAPSECEAVLAELDRYGIASYERERERVQIAIVCLSEGKFERLLQFIATAKNDYRDVLH